MKTKDERFRACHDFDPEFICWDFGVGEEEFVSWIEENTELRLIKKFNASMDIGVCTTPTEDTYKLDNSIDLSKIPKCKGKCDSGYWRINDCFFERRRFRNKLESIDNLNLIESHQIYEFIRYEEKFIDLIIESINLIRNYFPHSKIYLAYEWDYDNRSLESICAYIYSDDKNKDENYSIYKYKLFPDFFKLRKSYGDFNYYIEMIDSDELIKLLEED